MSDYMENKLNDENLEAVAGGVVQAAGYSVEAITPKWVEVVVNVMEMRDEPNGRIVREYPKGHKLKVDAKSGKWYRVPVYMGYDTYDYGFIEKKDVVDYNR